VPQALDTSPPPSCGDTVTSTPIRNQPRSGDDTVPAQIATTPRTVSRLDIHTGTSFEDFRQAFETAAPSFDVAAVQAAITARGGTWDDIRDAVAANLPHGLMVFASIDAGALMAAAGHHTPAVEYLLGNHVVAERMFRHDAAALLYAPLRVLLHGDERGEAVFTLDQPSTVFASLDDPWITEIGIELDAKVSDLLTHLGVDAAASLTPRT
jgi:uncharacterized protein (DUF302 family)